MDLTKLSVEQLNREIETWEEFNPIITNAAKKELARRGNEPEKVVVEDVPKGDSYTEDEAYEMNREEQEAVLDERGVKYTSRMKESTLVKKILKSNP